MPLLAYTQSGEPLIAPLMSDEEWERLRSDPVRDAWMPYGKGPAVPKLSRLGTRFFAHSPGHAPESTGETDLHLYLKAQCLIGARDAGWEALPEQSGATPDRQQWRADVLCRRPGNPWSVAFEAQISLQSEDTYRQRQERYTSAGLRALWLVAHEPVLLRSYWRHPDKGLPAFITETGKDERGRPHAHVKIDGLRLPVAEFVTGALSRHLHWYEDRRHAVVTLILHETQCWHLTCRSKVLLASRAETQSKEAIGILELAVLPGYSDAFADAQARLPALASTPEPFRRGFSVRCRQCGRSIRHGSFEWLAYQEPAATLPIGIPIPDGIKGSLASRLRHHSQWHWAEQSRWSNWAPIGGAGSPAILNGGTGKPSHNP